MAVSDEFLEYVVEQLADWAELQARRMFGGVGLYCQGRMFGLIADDILYFKVSDLNRDDFKKAGSLPFRPYPHKKITMSYWEIPGEVLEDRDELARWAAKSLAVTKKP